MSIPNKKKITDKELEEGIDPEIDTNVNPGNNFGTGQNFTPGTNFGTNESVEIGPKSGKSEIDKDIERIKREERR